MQRPEVGVRHWTQPAVNISGSTVTRHLAMLPDARTDPSRVSSLSPSAAVGTGRRSQSPARTAVPKRLFKRQAVSTLSPAHTPVANEPSSNRLTATDIFVCDEESQFYSQCLEKLLVKNSSSTQTVIEFGSGDGTPVIGCLMASQFSGTIHGFELNRKAAELARSKAAETLVSKRYRIHNSCFFQGMHDIPASCLIANPPYIPAPDNKIMMPALHGGEDGANLTRELMTLGFDSAILLLSSYANPVETLEFARQNGYQVTDFMISPMPFGTYSSEPKVKSHIWKMRAEGRAFCSDSWYLLAGVLFQKRKESPATKRKSHKADGSNGQVSNGNQASSMVYVDGETKPELIGDCSGLRHRYSSTADGSVNAAEDQTDELIKIMTALH